MPTDSNSSSRRGRRQLTPIDTTYAHLQPQAIEVEQVVIGALMIDGDAFGDISEQIRPETFYDPRHQHIFTAIQNLSINDRPVDIVTVIEELRREGTLENVGGEVYVMELAGHVASAAHLEYHAKIIQDKYIARQLIKFAAEVETKAFSQVVDVDELMQETEGALFELAKTNFRQDYLPIAPILTTAVETLQNAGKNSTGLTGLPTGYARLDKLTSGWQASDLIIIAGRPAMGKTSLALSLAKNLAVDYRVPTAFFSLEMSNIQLGNRLLSNFFEIEGSKILSGQLNESEYARIDKNRDRLWQAPLYIDDTASLSVFELRTKARRLVREKGVKAIFIDYLQLMTASGMKYGNRQEEVSSISKSLKGLAKELNIPIIALSQLNRSVEKRDDKEGKRPQLSDLRESGAIEQDSDMVIFVHRPEYYKLYQDENGNDMHGKAELIIAKHRKGATDVVLLRFKGQFTRFEDYDSSMDVMGVPTDGGEIIGSRLNIAGTQTEKTLEMDPLGGEIDEGDIPY